MSVEKAQPRIPAPIKIEAKPNEGGTRMTPKVSTGFARRLLVTVAAIAFAPVAFIQSSGAQVTANQTFFELNNPIDPMFNQLLGINDQQIIVGYYGDGMIVPNHGYVLVPKNHYSVEDFTNLPAGDLASQTQAIGINNNTTTTNATTNPPVVTVHLPDIVGFYTDPATTFTHGFLDSNGIQSTLDDPAGSPPNVAQPVQNLLGINNAAKAAGFWTDNNGHEHGFIVEINTQSPATSTFREIPPATFGANAVATQASGINNNSQLHPGEGDLVCGFWTDTQNNNHGFTVFLGQQGFQQFNPLTLPVAATSVFPFGCNDQGRVVGSFTDNQGNTHGFIFDTTDFHIYDAQGSSQTPAFGVKGTFINGVNNNGAIVGIFSDGENVNGFVDFAPVQ
jgi:probable HAF family extracellular repeat protein